jgi:hypothetical protein
LKHKIIKEYYLDRISDYLLTLALVKLLFTLASHIDNGYISEALDYFGISHKQQETCKAERKYAKTKTRSVLNFYIHT